MTSYLSRDYKTHPWSTSLMTSSSSWSKILFKEFYVWINFMEIVWNLLFLFYFIMSLLNAQNFAMLFYFEEKWKKVETIFLCN